MKKELVDAIEAGCETWGSHAPGKNINEHIADEIIKRFDVTLKQD